MKSGEAAGLARIPQLLAEDIEALDEDQQAALTADGNVVIVAGPGSGKTRTLVARAGYLLCTQISPLRGLAAITYTNQAALELRQGLARLGLSEPHRLFAGTVHSFCLSEILPYAALVGIGLPTLESLMTTREVNGLRDECAEAVGANRWGLKERFASLRRRMAAGEDVSDQSPAYVNAVERYERECDRLSIWDFDGVVFKSITLLRDFPEVAAIVRAKFPMILIDEYQDLGAALHRLVETLILAGVAITAVGDADQSIFGFTGGDPRYLEALGDREDFATISLVTNYRCGSAVISAANIALAAQRRWRADPARKDAGTIEIRTASGDSRTQARQAAHAVDQFLDAGVPPSEVAVLVRFRAPLAPLIHEELTSAGVKVRLEGTSTSPQSSMGKWLAASALYATQIAQQPSDLSQPAPRPEGADVLLDNLDRMRSQAGHPRSMLPALARIHALHATLTRNEPDGSRHTPTWTAQVAADLGLNHLALRLGDGRNLDDLNAFLEAPRDQVLEEVASDLESTGRVVVGTYHGAKGRTFTAVILPALTEGVVPPWGLDYGHPVPLRGPKLGEERRGFYVALTRSRGSVLIHAATTGVDNRGREINRGFSTFAQELADQLGVTLV